MAGTPETVGERFYLVRVALGRSVREPMPIREFAALLSGHGAKRYTSSTVSLLERNEQKPNLDDVAAWAAIDPLRRGKLWFGWGEEVDATMAPDDLRPRMMPASALTPAPTPEEFARQQGLTRGRKPAG